MSIILFCAQTYAATILIFGDSLSAGYGIESHQGWVNIIKQSHPQHKWINGSVSGETTAGGLRRLPALLSTTEIDIIFIELGGNDGLRGFAPQELKNNLNEMILLAKSQQIEVLLSQVMVPPNYGPRYAKAFAESYQELAEQHQLTLVPFFMESIATKPELMQGDGIHPNAEAQPLIADFLTPWFEKAI